MLVSAKLGAFFRGGAQVGESATHFSRPTPTAIRELTFEDTPLLPIGLGLCRIAAMEFRGCTFHVPWWISLRSIRLTPPSDIMNVADP